MKPMASLNVMWIAEESRVANAAPEPHCTMSHVNICTFSLVLNEIGSPNLVLWCKRKTLPEPLEHINFWCSMNPRRTTEGSWVKNATSNPLGIAVHSTNIGTLSLDVGTPGSQNVVRTQLPYMTTTSDVCNSHVKMKGAIIHEWTNKQATKWTSTLQ